MSSEAAESAKAQVYEVTVLFDASSSVKVSAHSPEEAAHLAEDEANGRQHLCHQCSDEIETGDIIGSIVYCEGERVAETTWSAERIASLEAERDTQAARIAELEAERGTAGYARKIESLIAERDTLRAEVERLRKPLTDERICELWSWSATAEAERTATTQQHAFARAIEAAKEAK